MTVSSQSIPFDITSRFSQIFVDYLNGEEKLKVFYTYRPELAAFKKAIEDKSKEKTDRDLLVKVLEDQYKKAGISTTNFQSIADPQTFTVCTGHQLCLFTGPLYFIYKIVTTINLADELSKKYPGQKFLPVYWMASEDHDFEEVSSIHLFGKTLQWNGALAGGPVGRISTGTLKPLIDELSAVLGTSGYANELIALFEEAYLKHSDLATATRVLVHKLFGDKGLVILDGDDKRLKEVFLPVIKDDISNSTNFKLVSESIKKLQEQNYSIQVKPREINSFRMTTTERIRIETADKETLNLPAGEYSPNVVLRPLYQQMILPNLAYVGGPGEIAYWLEFKSMFDHHGIAFPVLMPRNFALLSDERTTQTLAKLGLQFNDLFSDAEQVIKDFVKRTTGDKLSLSSEEEAIQKLYLQITEKVVHVDPSLKGTAEAELQKTLAGLKNIENKLLKAEKQKQETSVAQIRKIRAKFLPEDVLQERYENFSPYYQRSGHAFIEQLYSAFDPFKYELQIIEIK
jgi:uncharacterized protein YllA (UPF0747 family)